MNTDTRPNTLASDLAGVRSIGTLAWLFSRFAIGGLFALAALNKLRGPNGPDLFYASVKSFRAGEMIGLESTPEWFLRFSVSVTPWVEAICACALLLGVYVRASALVCAAWLMFFIVLIASVLSRGLNVDCGCFGELSPICGKQVGVCNIVQNLVMLVCTGILVFVDRNTLTLDRILRLGTNDPSLLEPVSD